MKAGPHRNIIIIALVTACALLGDSMLYIALPIYWREAGLDGIWQVGILLAINRFVRLPLNPLVGWLYNKIPLKTGLLFAIILSVITTTGYGWASSFAAWLVLRCLWGLAWSFLRIGGLSAVVVYGDRKKRGEEMGVYNGLYRLGSLVGMLVGGGLTPVFGLSWVSFAFGLLSSAGAILLAAFFKRKEPARPPKAERKKGFPGLDLLRSHAQVMTSGFFITFLIQGVFTATLSSIIVYHYGESVQLWGVVITAAALSGGLQGLRWMWEPFLAKQIGLWSDGPKGRLPLYIGSLIIGAVSFLLLPFPFPPYVWIVISLIALLASTALTTLLDAIAADRARNEETVKFFTYYTVVQDLGAACGPLAGFFLLTYTFGYELLFSGCAAILLLLTLTWLSTYRKRPSAGKSTSL
ncbi:MFS transporter [Paenibacillus senegalensis]|uniref:MFS transporter n=1 Tax=Paenibacillus senegalensis TaxID=1465766 RepID=UPI001B3095B7|nr:MFS transporter [Paenibacillus senegalensis]